MADPKAGDIAPDFELPADGARMVRLSDLRGKKVVLFFYPKDDTSACTAEAIAFSALKESFAEADTVVIGMSPDSVRKHDRYKAKHDLTVWLVSDEQKTALQDYGVWAEKTMFGRKYMGVVRTTVLVDRAGRIARIWPKVSVEGHAEEVLEAATALA